MFRILLEYVPLGSVANMLRVMIKLEEEVVRLFTRQVLISTAARLPTASCTETLLLVLQKYKY